MYLPVIQLPSHVRLHVTPQTAACQASLFLTISHSCPNSYPLHWWCHPAISSSDALFSSCPQSFPASGTFPVSQLLASDDQNTGVSASASVLPMSIQGWFPLRLTCLISSLSKGLSGILSSITAQRHQFLGTLPSLQSSSHSVCDQWENDSFDFTDFVGRVMSLLFNTLSRFVIAFLPRSKRLLISSLSTVIFGAREEEICHDFPLFPLYLPCSNGAGCHDLSCFNIYF